MLEFTFSDTLSARLNAGAKAAQDFTVPMRAIADVMRTHANERFQEERGPDGKPWKKSQRAIEDGGRTLHVRGHLQGSIFAESDATSALSATADIRAAIHQFGGTIRPKASSGKKALNTPFGLRSSVTIPARPFLGFGPVDIIEIEEILIDHLDNALKAGR